MGISLGMFDSLAVKVLNKLGITTGGVYTPPAAGMSNPATADLSMATYAINARTGSGPAPSINTAGDPDTGIVLAGSNAYQVLAGGGIKQETNATSTYFFHAVGVSGALSVEGAVTGRAAIVAITAGVGAPTTLTEAQSGSLVTNTGTTVKAACTLPDAATVGTFFDFLCDDADGFRIVADSGATITLGALGASASAGYVETVRQDSAFRLTLTAANVWRGTRIEGTWRKDSTTACGYAFTPTPWTSYTPTHNWDADGDVSESGYYQHFGASVTVMFQLLISAVTNSLPPATSFALDAAPAGFTLDTAKLPALGSYNAKGTVLAFDSSTSGFFGGVPFIATTVQIRSSASSTTAWSNTSPMTWAPGDIMSIEYTIPVT